MVITGFQEDGLSIQDLMAKSPWHTHYHVEQKAGVNDPGGFPTLMEKRKLLFLPKFPIWCSPWVKSWVQTER